MQVTNRYFCQPFPASCKVVVREKARIVTKSRQVMRPVMLGGDGLAKNLKEQRSCLRCSLALYPPQALRQLANY